MPTGKAYQFLTHIINTGRYLEWAEATHQTWRSTKESQGWTYGPVRDNAGKTSPFLRPFADLPAEIKGQNSFTPYAVVNFFRTRSGQITLAELDELLAQIVNGQQPGLLEELAEYVHSHFVAVQLARGNTVHTRDDLQVYQDLPADVQSWDRELALEMISHLRQTIAAQQKNPGRL